MAFPIFAITDGTPEHRIDLLKFLTLVDFKSSVIEPQGGTWGVTPFADGRVPIDMTLGNLMIEATLSAEGCNQDDVAYKGQQVRQLLENARQYWLSPSLKTPVWVEMQGSTESNPRYAYIYDYRAPGSGNPFSAPLFDSNKSMLIFPLVLETTPWQSQPLGLSDCIETSNIQEGARVVVTDHWHVTAPVNINYNDYTVMAFPSNHMFIGGTHGYMGKSASSGDGFHFYNNFRNINIPSGSKIHSAFIRFTSIGNYAATVVSLFVKAERNVNPNYESPTNPNYFSGTYAGNIVPRVYHNRWVSWTPVPAWTTGNTYDTPDISVLVQLVVNEVNWDDCQAIGLVVFPNITSCQEMRAARTMATTPGEPELHIVYSEAGDVGRDGTCLKEVIISNKHNFAQITHIYRYDDGAPGTYTDLMLAGLPYALFPTIPVVGDALLLGIDTALANFGPFRSFVLDLLTACEGMTFDISYSTTAGWGDPATLGYTDNTNGLGVLGVSSYHFKQPLDFDHHVENGVDAWWIKIEVASVLAGYVVPVQQNRHIYTVVTPYFEIDEDQIKGDLPALARTFLYGRSYSAGDTPDLGLVESYPKKIILATRRLSRGVDFTAYLNASDAQLPPGVSFSVTGSRTTIVEDASLGALDFDTGSPTGRMMLFTPVGVVGFPAEAEVRWTFDYNMAKQYAGRYAIYVRCALDGAGLSNFQFSLQIGYGSGPSSYTTYQTKSVFLGANPLYTYIDTVSIMEDIMEDEHLSNFHINLLVGCPDDGAYKEMYIYDLILIPIDEFLAIADTSADILAVEYLVEGHKQSPGEASGVFVDVDSIGNPKTYRITARDEGTGDYLANMNRLSRNPWMLNPRTAQRVWHFSPGDFEIAHMVQQFAISRYLDLRGND